MENVVKARKSFGTAKLVKIGMLSAVSIVLMMFEVNFPIFPFFLKMDLGDLPSLVGAVAMGPMAGVMIELIKNIVDLLKTSSAGVGQVANFVMGVCLVLPIGIFYKKNKTLKSFILGALVGSLLMAFTACVLNYYVLIPAFAVAFGSDINEFVVVAQKINPNIVDLKTLIYFSIAPFNFLKAVIVATLGYIVCKVLKPIM